MAATAPHATKTFAIQGRDVRLPVEVRDATAAVTYYLVPAAAAQKLIDPSGLRVATVLPGRALCTIGTMVYRDNDLGPYHEVAITFFVRERGQRSVPLLGTAVGLVLGSLGAYIHWLPVNGEFTCEAGRRIWGFPKFVTEIDISASGKEQTARVSENGEHIFTHVVAEGPASQERGFGDRNQLSYAFRDGVCYRTPSVMRGEAVSARLRGGRLELGDHPIARELGALGFPKRALFSTYISKMSGTFGAAVGLPQ
jgi:hypothetical protein